MQPITREEMYLAKICKEYTGAVPVPVARMDYYMAAVAGAYSGSLPAPVTRQEMYWSYIAGANRGVPNPVTRVDKFLYYLCGRDIDLPTPITREEIYLTKLTRKEKEYDRVFGNNSWDDIAEVALTHEASKWWNIGDEKLLDLGAEGIIPMQIAGFDVDDLADGGGKAGMTLISKNLLKTTHRMNPSRATNEDGTYKEGTGTVGGWEKCEMRQYLNETILPMFPDELSSNIKQVKKVHGASEKVGVELVQETIDKIWIPSRSETGEQADEAIYDMLFFDDNSRIKTIEGAIKGWWERDISPSSVTNFCIVATSGKGSYASPTNGFGVCIGFCL